MWSHMQINMWSHHTNSYVDIIKKSVEVNIIYMCIPLQLNAKQMSMDMSMYINIHGHIHGHFYVSKSDCVLKNANQEYIILN